MAALKGTLTLSDPAVPAGLTVAHRNVTITLNGGAPTTVDYVDPAAKFDCNEGDSLSATEQEVYSDGSTSTVGPAFTTTCNLVVAPAQPAGATITGATFELA